MVPCTWRAPAPTAARELATPQPESSWVWIPIVALPPSSSTTAAVARATSSGSVAPLVSQSTTVSAPASTAARRQRRAEAASARGAAEEGSTCVGPRPSPVREKPAQPVDCVRHAQLLVGRQRHALTLHAVAQGGVVDLDARVRHALDGTRTTSSHSR